MEITLKLYAGLSQYLPDNSENNTASISINSAETAYSVLEKFNVPKESAHLVLLNGVYMEVEERGKPRFKEGDTLAIWPPVAGG